MHSLRGRLLWFFKVHWGWKSYGKKQPVFSDNTYLANLPPKRFILLFCTIMRMPHISQYNQTWQCHYSFILTASWSKSDFRVTSNYDALLFILMSHLLWASYTILCHVSMKETKPHPEQGCNQPFLNKTPGTSCFVFFNNCYNNSLNQGTVGRVIVQEVGRALDMYTTD